MTTTLTEPRDLTLGGADKVFDAMSVHYRRWVGEQNLPDRSAEEMLWEDITPEQRRWLSRFIVAWESYERLTNGE